MVTTGQSGYIPGKAQIVKSQPNNAAVRDKWIAGAHELAAPQNDGLNNKEFRGQIMRSTVLKVAGIAAAGFFALTMLYTGVAYGAIVNVPDDYASIRDAVTAAAPGDTVRIARGTYTQLLPIEIDKDLTIESSYAVSGNPADIALTIIVGDGVADIQSRLFVLGDQSGGIDVNVSISGLTIKDAGRPITAFGASANISDIVIDGCGTDGMSFERQSSGVLENSLIRNCGDDAVDIDGKVGPYVIRNNTLLNSADDNLEARLLFGTEPGPAIEYFITGNRIEGAGDGDGIQIIDENPAESRRVFRIEKNLIIGNRYAGIGTLPDGITKRSNATLVAPYPDFALAERLYIINNTLAGNDVGVHGGDNSIVLNNIIADSVATGALHIKGAGTPRSIVDYNMLFNNPVQLDGVPPDNQGGSNWTNVDPLLTAEFDLTATSAAIDAGARTYTWLSEAVLDISGFLGSAPDLGAREFMPTTGGTVVINTRVNTSADDAEQRDTTMNVTSTDLDMVLDSSYEVAQLVGIRFDSVNIPPAATILDANVQFRAEETTSGVAVLAIAAHATDDAPSFGVGADNISGRVTTGAVVWNPPAWTAGDAGVAQATPNIATIIQQIVNRPGWSAGNAIALVISGGGRRVADTFDGRPGDAALLRVEFVTTAEADDDNDGIANSQDNCSAQSNPQQIDADGDGIGNRCDADLNNDCIINSVDLGLFRAVFWTADAVADFNADGTVNAQDVGIMRSSFLAAPGPSGLANACSF